MSTHVVVLSEDDVGELKIIVMDKDREEALKFLKEKVLNQITRKEKKKMDVDGKTHL